jgi:hypothetical protein
MGDRETLLGNLVVGDIFHAVAPKVASLICLVVSVTETALHTRRVTTRENLVFDRRTGVTVDELSPCTIDSVAPLPVDVYNVMLGIDRKSRLENDPERIKLSDAEKKAFVFVTSHYASYPI